MIPRIFFLHIPKCGGTTLHHLIEQQYEPQEIYTVPAVSWQEECYQGLKNKWAPDMKKRIRVVKGHMLYGWHTAFGDDPFTYITFLRHPVDRIASLYHFSRNSNGAHYLAEEAEKYSLAEFAALDVTELRNYMTHSIAGYLGVDRAILSKAFFNLGRDFSFMGIVERMASGIQVLRNQFGWSGRGVEALNVNPHDEVTEDARIAIEQHNQLDMELYEAVRSAFWLYEAVRSAFW
jgi:hypothetical protein